MKNIPGQHRDFQISEIVLRGIGKLKKQFKPRPKIVKNKGYVNMSIFLYFYVFSILYSKTF